MHLYTLAQIFCFLHSETSIFYQTPSVTFRLCFNPWISTRFSIHLNPKICSYIQSILLEPFPNDVSTCSSPRPALSAVQKYKIFKSRGYCNRKHCPMIIIHVYIIAPFASKVLIFMHNFTPWDKVFRKCNLRNSFTEGIMCVTQAWWIFPYKWQIKRWPNTELPHSSLRPDRLASLDTL